MSWWVATNIAPSNMVPYGTRVISPVIDGQAGTYGARLERVVAARAAVEQRLHKRLDLLDGYARVVNMVEIEVRCHALLP